MGRGAQLSVGPSRIWTLRVEQRHRIRLPVEINEIVPWLKDAKEPVESVAVPGPVGGVQVKPLAAYQSVVRRLNDAVAASPPSIDEASDDWVDVGRLLATAWPVSFSLERTPRFTMTIPEDARRATLLPGAGGTVVVFAFGEVVEIWDAGKWYEHVRVIAKSRVERLDQAIEDLAGR